MILPIDMVSINIYFCNSSTLTKFPYYGFSNFFLWLIFFYNLSTQPKTPQTWSCQFCRGKREFAGPGATFYLGFLWRYYFQTKKTPKYSKALRKALNGALNALHFIRCSILGYFSNWGPRVNCSAPCPPPPCSLQPCRPVATFKCNKLLQYANRFVATCGFLVMQVLFYLYIILGCNVLYF